MPPAARKFSDKTLCQPGIPGTGTFTVVTGDSAQVMIDFEPAVCETDMFSCTGTTPPTASVPCVTGLVKKGSATVKIGHKPAARQGDPTQCNGTGAAGVIVSGSSTVIIGDAGGGGGGGGGSSGSATTGSNAGTDSQISALRHAKESAVGDVEIENHSQAQATNSETALMPAKLPPTPPPVVHTCHLAQMTLKCGHSDRAYTLIVGEQNAAGIEQKLLQVVAGSEGDNVLVTTTMDKPYCEKHFKKPFDIAPSQAKEKAGSVTPTSATTTVIAKPAPLFDELPARPFAFIWPRNYRPVRYVVAARNCGLTQTALIDAFPDIRWTVGFSIALGDEYSKKYSSEKRVWEDETKRGTTGSTLKVEYGKHTVDYNNEISLVVDKISSASRTALKILDYASTFLEKWCSTKVSLKPPTVFVEGQWGWCERKESWQADYEITAKAGFDPLIGISVEFDCIQAILTIVASPAAARLKKVLDDAVAEVGIFIKIDGEIGGEFAYSKALGQKVSSSSGTVNGEILASIEGRIKAEKKVQLFDISESEIGASAELKVGGKTKLFSGELSAFSDHVGIGGEGEISMGGLEFYLECVASVTFIWEFERSRKYSHKFCDPKTIWNGKRYLLRNDA